MRCERLDSVIVTFNCRVPTQCDNYKKIEKTCCSYICQGITVSPPATPPSNGT